MSPASRRPGLAANDMPFLPYFPYVGPPQNPLNHLHHDERGARVSVAPSAPERDGALAGAGLRMASRNPGPDAALQYSLAKPAHVTLRVYDVQGRVVRSLVDQDADAGTFRAEWDGGTEGGSKAARGVYFVRMTADGRPVDTRKVMLR